jgi:tryptophan-rich sensory protein
MGVSAARVFLAPASRERNRAMQLFFLQLAANVLWSLLFFNLQAYGAAFVWILVLWLLILGMILTFVQVDRPAALLQLPYLLWVTFAALLNFMVWQLN